MSLFTTVNTLPAPVQQDFDMKLLARPMPDLIHNVCAERRTLPGNSGRILRRRRYNNLATATVPLGASGITPPPQQLSAVDIDAEISFYGTYVLVTDQVTLINQDPVFNETVSLLSQSLQETEDELIRNALLSTASQVNCTGGTNGDNPTNISRQDVDEIVNVLRGYNAKYISDQIMGEDKYGSGPIRKAYFGMGHVNLIPDLNQVQGWINVANYPSANTQLTAEEGAISNIRFLLSTLGAISPNASALGQDVYNVFITGMESYQIVDLSNASSRFIYQPPGSAGSADPLAQRQTMGYIFAGAYNVTNDQWVQNLRCTLS